MLKALRTFKEKTGPSVGEDADDKKRIIEIRDAAQTLQRTLGYFFKTMLDHAANTAAVHEDLANLYPASQKASNAVALLNSSGAVFHDTPMMVEELRRVLERPIDKLINRTKDLLLIADERQVVRAEIEHYKSKVVKLANEGLGNAQKQTKAESNQEKLLSNQKRFGELNAQLTAAMTTIDSEIGAATDSAIATYAQLQANYASGLLHCFGTAVGGLPTDLRNAATAGTSASALKASRDAAAAAAAGGPSVSATDAGAAPPTAPRRQQLPQQPQAPAGGDAGDDEDSKKSDAPTSVGLAAFLGGSGGGDNEGGASGSSEKQADEEGSGDAAGSAADAEDTPAPAAAAAAADGGESGGSGGGGFNPFA